MKATSRNLITDKVRFAHSQTHKSIEMHTAKGRNQMQYLRPNLWAAPIGNYIVTVERIGNQYDIEWELSLETIEIPWD